MANAVLSRELTQQPVALSLNAALWAVRCLFWLNGFLYANWATRIPAIQSQFQLSNGTLGLALMVLAAGAVVAMPSTGWLCSCVGSRRIVVISLVVCLLALPTISLTSGLGALVAVLFIFGVGHGTLDVSMNLQALEVERRLNQPVNSSIHAMWSTGALTGAVTGSLFAMGGASIRWHFVIVAAMLAFAAVPIISRLLIDDVDRDQDKHNENTRRSPSTSDGEIRSHGEGQDTDILQPERAPRRVTILLGVIAFCVMASEGAMADWSAVLLHQSLGASEGVAALGYATFAIAMASGRFAGDGLAARLGPVKQVRISALVALLGFSIVVTSTHLLVALGGFTLIGVGLATVVPAVFSACGRIPGASPGVALATVSTIGYFGFLLGPPLIGFLSEWSSLRVALGALAGTMLVTMALASATRPQSA